MVFRTVGIALFVCSAAPTTPVLAGPRPQSGELNGTLILRRYGAPGAKTIDASRFARFLQDEQLARVDQDEVWPKAPPQLDAGEYQEAWLPQDLSSGDLTADGAGNGIPAAALVDSRSAKVTAAPIWSAVTGEAVQHQKRVMSSVSRGPSYSVADLELYLAAREPSKRGPEARVALLRQVAGDPTTIRQGKFRRFFLIEALLGWDEDGSGGLDPWELRDGFLKRKVGDAKQAYGVYVGLLRAGAPGARSIPLTPVPDLERRIYQTAAGQALRAPLVAWANTEGAKAWSSSTGVGAGGGPPASMPIAHFRRGFQAEAAEPSRLVEGRGYLLNPAPLRIDKKSVADPRKDSWWLLVRRDARVPGVATLPADFALSQNADRVESVQVNGSVGVLWQQAADVGLTHEGLVSARWERSRVKGDSPVNVDKREYYAGWSGLTDSEWGPFSGHRFRAGLVRSEDQRNDVTRNAVLAEWFPLLGGGATWRSSDWNTLAPRTLEAYYYPALALDVGDYEDNGADVEEAVSWSRLELGGGLRFLGQVTLKVQVRAYTDLGELDRSYLAQESGFNWPILGSDSISLNLVYKSGREAPTFEDAESVELGLGVKL